MSQAFIGLGSNLQNPKRQLFNAIHQIETLTDTQVIAVSDFYRSKAIGPGDQPDYVNAVIQLNTQLAPEKLLDHLQAIEHQQGRTRGEERWLPRTLDLDILLYDQATLNTERLQVPHPRMTTRNFVMQPLHDLAPELILPGGETVTTVLKGLSDDGLWRLEKPQFIAVEGPIGVGKTTLSRKLAETFGAQIVLEGVYDNPFLPAFYEDPERWALATQLSFLQQRAAQLESLKLSPEPSPQIVADYLLAKDGLFAEITLQDAQLELYQQLRERVIRQAPTPDLVVYLHAPTPVLQRRIAQRARSFETQISDDYLIQLGRAYEAFFSHYHDSPLVTVDTTRTNLAESARDYEYFVEYILSKGYGHHQFSMNAQ